MERELLEELLSAFNKLDTAYCTYLNRGKSNLSGEEYEKIEDVSIKVEEFLKGNDK